ncbi:MAG: biopolymer transporter ExbD [Candidatus Manganitrophaceae bacterium]|nr:MAG: biopolymer transporter ExbD [Candidatus Manganitrophaceae bacterium]
MVRRMKRRKVEIPYLNLISLMDMFTILVIFLLFQASSGEEMISIAKDVILPISTASQPPRRALTVTVTPNEILVDGTRVAETPAVLQEKEVVISSLRTRISAAGGKKVTILGDRTIPFALLKKVMVTCTESGIEQISLAVLSRET